MNYYITDYRYKSYILSKLLKVEILNTDMEHDGAIGGLCL